MVVWSPARHCSGRNSHDNLILTIVDPQHPLPPLFYPHHVLAAFGETPPLQGTQWVLYTGHIRGTARMHIAQVETDIPLADYPPTYKDYRHKVDAALASCALLTDDVLEVSPEELDSIYEKFDALAVQNSADLSLPVQSPEGLLHLKAMLSTYDHEVVQSAAQLRRYITNKLIEESSHPDAKIRLKALEMLGKISDVGLFTEKTEVTLRHRPTEELEQLLRERLAKVIDMDAAPVPPNTLAPMSPL